MSIVQILVVVGCSRNVDTPSDSKSRLPAQARCHLWNPGPLPISYALLGIFVRLAGSMDSSAHLLGWLKIANSFEVTANHRGRGRLERRRRFSLGQWRNGRAASQSGSK